MVIIDRVSSRTVFSTIWGQMSSHGVFDDFHQSFFRISRANLHGMQQLDHQSRKSLVRPWHSHSRVHLDKHILCGVDENLDIREIINFRVPLACLPCSMGYRAAS